MPIIRAPFTDEQVENLNAWQKMGWIHEYTCGNKDKHPKDTGSLIATKKGWVCPYCNYTQAWAHDFAADRKPTPDDREPKEPPFHFGKNKKKG
jgi:hypothetical protein